MVWRCANPDCAAQVRGRIEHWCARGAMDIDGAGEVLVAQLAERGLVPGRQTAFKVESGGIASH